MHIGENTPRWSRTSCLAMRFGLGVATFRAVAAETDIEVDDQVAKPQRARYPSRRCLLIEANTLHDKIPPGL